MEELEALLGQGPKGSELWRVAFSPFDSFEHAENEFPFFLQHSYVRSRPLCPVLGFCFLNSPGLQALFLFEFFFDFAASAHETLNT